MAFVAQFGTIDKGLAVRGATCGGATEGFIGDKALELLRFSSLEQPSGLLLLRMYSGTWQSCHSCHTVLAVPVLLMTDGFPN